MSLNYTVKARGCLTTSAGKTEAVDCTVVLMQPEQTFTGQLILLCLATFK